MGLGSACAIYECFADSVLHIISKKDPKPALFDALRFLGLQPEASILSLSIEQMLEWAIKTYRMELVPKSLEIQVSEDPNSAFCDFLTITK